MQETMSVFRQTVRLLLGDPGPVISYIVTPLLMMAILRPANELILQTEFPAQAQNINGAEQVVPAFVVMFSFFWARSIGENFLLEHGWGTWERLQMSFAKPSQILIGKILPVFFILSIQHFVLFVGGALIFSMDWNGAIGGMFFVLLALNVCVMSLGLMLVTICRTMTQVEAIGTLLTLLFAAFGGSLVPSSALPEWAETIAPATPSYWALDAARGVILEGEGLGFVAIPTLAILGFALLFGLVVALRFSFDQAKFAEA